MRPAKRRADARPVIGRGRKPGRLSESAATPRRVAVERPRTHSSARSTLAYRYLNRRDRTEAEVRRRLEQAARRTGALDEAIAILIDQGVLDDARFARLFVAGQARARAVGQRSGSGGRCSTAASTAS